MGDSKCRYCEQGHKPRYLCEPAKKVLDALAARGQRFDVPEVEFPTPQPVSEVMGQLGLGQPGDAVLRQFLAQAAIIPVAGVPQAGVIVTGEDIAGRKLPRWLYVGDETDMVRAVELFGNMAALALRRTAEARAQAGL